MDVAAFKKTFFDSKAVTDKVPPAIKKALSKMGAFVRQRAKSSLKYGKGASKPGRPPTVHKSNRFTRASKVKGKAVRRPASPLRELLFFGYDAARQSVVIGPALGGAKSGAPRTLEEGGAATIKVFGRKVRASIAPRPTMGPAFRAELDKAGGAFQNLVK